MSTLFFPSYDVYNTAMNHDLQLAAAICQQVALGGGGGVWGGDVHILESKRVCNVHAR